MINLDRFAYPMNVDVKRAGVIQVVSVPHLLQRSVDAPAGLVAIDGLENKVTIRRDELGVPFIEAQNENDLHFALGYTTASDRLWQMYVLSRLAQGRISEIAGEDLLNVDIYIRTLGVKHLTDTLYRNFFLHTAVLMPHNWFCRTSNTSRRKPVRNRLSSRNYPDCTF